jgi:hypothetical protein
LIRFQPIITKLIDFIKNLPQKNPFDIYKGVMLWLRNTNEDIDFDIFGDDVVKHTISDISWNGLNIEAPTINCNSHSVLGSLSSSTPPTLSFQTQSSPFYKFNGDHTQHAIASIEPITDLLDEEFTIIPPNIPELNEYYGRNYYFAWNQLRVAQSGVGIIIHIWQNSLSLHALKSQDLIEQVFSVYGLKSKQSHAGLLGRRLINQMGGLQDCRVFKIKGVRDLIEKYSHDQSFTRSAANMTIGQINTKGNPNFSKYEGLVIQHKPSRSKLTPDETFSYLVDKGVFRVGLKFRCNNCELSFWKHIDEVKTFTVCEFCGKEVNVSTQLKDRDWAFRRSGIFGRDNHQEGGIPVAVTLQQLNTTFFSGHFVYSTALDITFEKEDKKCETDFVVLISGYAGRAKLIIGECKTHKEITDQDVENLIEVADSFPEEIIDVFILFSKFGQFTPTEIELIKKTRMEIIIMNDTIYKDRAIMLSDRELEPYFMYEYASKEFKIEQHGSSVDNLVLNTNKIFIEPIRKKKSE